MSKTEPLTEKMNTDFFPIADVDYLEYYTGNARQAAHYFCQTYGFCPTAYSGLETGNRETTSYLVEQENVRFLITGAYSPDHEIASFVKKHGDGIKDIALRVEDVESAFSEAVSRGAIVIEKPRVVEDEQGILKKAVIGTYGDTVHTLVERKNYKGLFAPGFTACKTEIPICSAGITGIDHVVGNVKKWMSGFPTTKK